MKKLYLEGEVPTLSSSFFYDNDSNIDHFAHKFKVNSNEKKNWVKSEAQIQLQTQTSRSQRYGQVNFHIMEREFSKRIAKLRKKNKTDQEMVV